MELKRECVASTLKEMHENKTSASVLHKWHEEKDCRTDYTTFDSFSYCSLLR